VSDITMVCTVVVNGGCGRGGAGCRAVFCMGNALLVFC